MCICLLVCTQHHSPAQRGCFECLDKCHHARTHVALAYAHVYPCVFLGIGALTGIHRYVSVCQGMSGSFCDMGNVNMHQTCLNTSMSVYMHILGARSMWQSGCVPYTCVCSHTHMNVHMCP